MWSVLTLGASLIIAWEICARVWREGELRGAERATYVSIVAVAFWLASLWALALTHTMTRPLLIARTLVFAGIAAAIVIRRFRVELFRRQIATDAVVRYILPIVPLVLWAVFMLWRSAIVPPLTHDALSYHMPRALLFSRAGGYSSLESLRFLITPRPANYELMLAEALVMDGVDDYTEWLSVFAFIGFVVSAAALAQRWSGGNGDATLATALFAAASPIVLLHSGAHKNDLLTAYLLTASIVAVGRWLTEADWRALVMAAAGFAAAIGTKTPAFLVPLFLAPFIVWKVVRERMPWRRVLAVALAGLVLFVVLGGWTILPARHAADSTAQAGAPAAPDERQYGDWSNLWRGPWILLAAPFSLDSNELAVPWSANGWFWRRFEIYFSELGVQFTIAAVLLPFALFRRPSLERFAAVIATAASVAVILPVHRLPLGFYLIGIPRLVMHLSPVVFAATLAAGRRFAQYAVAVALLLFVGYGMACAIEDDFAPFDFVLWARAHPGTRVVPFSPYRAAEVLDRVAGPRDSVVMEAGPTAWTYPAYGRRLTRSVQFIPPGEGAPVIPKDAQWLVVDRLWNRVWGDPKFTDLGDWRQRLGRGHAPPEDLRVLRWVESRDEWEQVFLDPNTLQAVYRRRR